MKVLHWIGLFTIDLNLVLWEILRNIITFVSFLKMPFLPSFHILASLKFLVLSFHLHIQKIDRNGFSRVGQWIVTTEVWFEWIWEMEFEEIMCFNLKCPYQKWYKCILKLFAFFHIKSWSSSYCSFVDCFHCMIMDEVIRPGFPHHREHRGRFAAAVYPTYKYMTFMNARH